MLGKFLQVNLVLSPGLMWIGHHKEIQKLVFRALVLCPSDEGLMFKTSAFKSLYGGQFTLSTQLIKPNYLVILPTYAAPVSLETYPLYFYKCLTASLKKVFVGCEVNFHQCLCLQTCVGMVAKTIWFLDIPLWSWWIHNYRNCVNSQWHYYRCKMAIKFS